MRVSATKIHARPSSETNPGASTRDLGGGVIKRRIARPGHGKSGGFRTIILYRRESMAFFVYGFAKSDRADVRPDEFKAYRRLAREMLWLDDPALAAAIRNGTLREIKCHA